MLPKNKLNEKRLRAAIAQALNCKQGAKTIAQAFKEAGGARRAVETIDDLIPRANLSMEELKIDKQDGNVKSFYY